MAVGTLLLPGEVRHMGGHDTGGATSATVGQVASTAAAIGQVVAVRICLLYTSPSPRDLSTSRMPSSA